VPIAKCHKVADIGMGYVLHLICTPARFHHYLWFLIRHFCTSDLHIILVESTTIIYVRKSHERSKFKCYIQMVQPFVSQAEWKQTTQRTQMLQHEGNNGDAYLYSMLLPVPGMHRMTTTEGVPLLPSSFLQLTKLSSQSVRKCRCVTNCL